MIRIKRLMSYGNADGGGLDSIKPKITDLKVKGECLIPYETIPLAKFNPYHDLIREYITNFGRELNGQT